MKIKRPKIPYITVDQMREVDRLMIEEFHIDLIQMMENAGRNLAQLAIDRYYTQKPQSPTAIILAGRGGNGGGGLVCARHLQNHGVDVQVVLSQAAADFSGVPAHQLDILHRMGVPISEAQPADTSAALIIDALIGYSLRGAPRGRTAELIHWANEQSVPILSLDVPSGMEADSGVAFDPCIQADATMTLALPKTGFLESSAKPLIGDLFLADISVPQELLHRMGIMLDTLFTTQSIIQLSESVNFLKSASH